MTRIAGMLFLAALPLLANMDEDWKALYYRGQKAAMAGDYARAESIYVETLHTAETFGKSDIRVATTEQAMGVALHSDKKLSEAEEALQRAVAVYAVTSGEGTVELALAQFDLAGVLMDEGKYQSALQFLNLALPVFDQKMDPNDDKVAAVLCLQGDVYRMLKRYASAEASLKHCADIQTQNGNIGTAAFGDAANSLAIVYAHLGKTAEADRYFTFAAKIREQALGIESPVLAQTLEAHAALLHQMGRDAEAKQKERMAAAIRAHSGGK